MIDIAQIRLALFDLDDTLAPSKTRMHSRMADALTLLLRHVNVCIISGGQIEQFRAQVLDALGDDADLNRLHLMPTCGTRYYRHDAGEWTQVYAEDLDTATKIQVIDVLAAGAKELGLWEPRTWGPILEDRGSQITYSALGQAAPVDAKKEWDPDGRKKAALCAYAAPRLPELEVRSGGTTSVDVTRKGIDKAYGVRHLARHTGIDLADMIFFGDRLDEGGNDYPVRALGVASVAVTGWEDTEQHIRALLDARSTPAFDLRPAERLTIPDMSAVA